MDPLLEDEIRSMIAKHFSIDINRLTPETEISSLGIDSLGIIEFLFELEDKLKIRMAESRAPLKTVGDIMKEIQTAVANRPANA